MQMCTTPQPPPPTTTATTTTTTTTTTMRHIRIIDDGDRDRDDDNTSLAFSAAGSSASSTASAASTSHHDPHQPNLEEDGDDDDDDDDDAENSHNNDHSSSSHNKGLGGSGGSVVGEQLEDSCSPLVHNETQWLSKARMLMMLVLVVSTAVSATVTYKFTTRLEENDFSVRYNDFANQIVAVSQINAVHIFQFYGQMSLQLTASVSGNHHMAWPLVHFHDWGAMAQQAIDHTGAKYLAFTPLVEQKDRTSYEMYMYENAQDPQGWIYKSMKYDDKNITHPSIEDEEAMEKADAQTPTQPEKEEEEEIKIVPFIYEADSDGISPATLADVYAPVAQAAPLPRFDYLLNYNGFDFSYYKHVFDGMVDAKRAVLSEVLNYDQFSDEEFSPASFMLSPIYDRIGTDAKLVGALGAEMPWDAYFSNLIPEGIDGIVLVVRNTCGQQLSFEICGPEVQFMGFDDLHDPKYDEHEVSSDLNTAFTSLPECAYSLHLYPSDELVSAYQTNRPREFTMSVAGIFVLVSFIFVVYDSLVEKRQDKIMHTAIRSRVIVNSLFPANVRERLMEDAVQQQQQQLQITNRAGFASLVSSNAASMLESENGGGDTATLVSTAAGFLSSPMTTMMPSTRQRSGAFKTGKVDYEQPITTQPFSTRPIADLFPNSTVLFGDLVGFTAWSSVRQPSQVFILLETLYNAFDMTARKLAVFKVETIGDCYVAATGLPEQRADHAVAMVRFARHCMHQLHHVVQDLDRQLGPGTAELAMRFGIHSGPVTAGVLRGEKSRFQLFGDTVNTAARMESTGEANKIHLSQQTADLLVEAGKHRWIKARAELVTAKGKGQLQTYWLVFRSPSSGGRSSSKRSSSRHKDNSEYCELQQSSVSSIPLHHACAHHGDEEETIAGNNSVESSSIAQWSPQITTIKRPFAPKVDRMVAWEVDVLQTLLKKILAMRSDSQQKDQPDLTIATTLRTKENSKETVLDEVLEFITVPSKAATYQRDPDSIALSPNVKDQLYQYVLEISSRYQENAFHSFGHACHVTQSVMKLLARICPGKGEEQLHEYTYGIASDPLTQFACAFSALIHDVDHHGVSNAQLVKEGADLAKLYHNKSVAEQNSVDLAWSILMESRFQDLRACIYTNQEELDRFRQLVVNSVMATDVMDKELGQLRKKRWEKAFAEKTFDLEPARLSTTTTTTTARKDDEKRREDSNRKATIVIEHLIQASDVAHTMQHWHIYIKWNERLFHEMRHAYEMGRAEINPAANWYQGELNFFDYYIIPLAQKLKECGVFGVASDEYLLYARANRREWALKGKETVLGYLTNCKQQPEEIAKNAAGLSQFSIEVDSNEEEDGDASESVVSC